MVQEELSNNLYLSRAELDYVIKAVERMAPLAHHAEAAIQGNVLDELRRAQQVFKLTE